MNCGVWAFKNAIVNLLQINVIDIDSELELSQPRQDFASKTLLKVERSGAEPERTLTGELHEH